MFTGEVFIAVTAAAAAATAALAVHRFDQRMPRQGRRIIVNLMDGSAARGILTEQRGAWLVLRSAEMISGEASAAHTVRIDGELFIERPRVLFIQVLP